MKEETRRRTTSVFCFEGRALLCKTTLLSLQVMKRPVVLLCYQVNRLPQFHESLRFSPLLLTLRARGTLKRLWSFAFEILIPDNAGVSHLTGHLSPNSGAPLSWPSRFGNLTERSSFKTRQGRYPRFVKNLIDNVTRNLLFFFLRIKKALRRN